LEGLAKVLLYRTLATTVPFHNISTLIMNITAKANDTNDILQTFQ